MQNQHLVFNLILSSVPFLALLKHGEYNAKLTRLIFMMHQGIFVTNSFHIADPKCSTKS